MKRKIILGTVALIGLLMAAGLVLVACEPGSCTGTGECTVTVAQGTTGLYVDTNSPRSSCGDVGVYDPEYDSWSGGCQVANMQSYVNFQSHIKRAGTHSCNCSSSF